jgi:hypothetical protein
MFFQDASIDERRLAVAGRRTRWGTDSLLQRTAQNKDCQILKNCASFRSGEIRIFDSTGNVERIIPFNETERKL